MPRVRRAMCRPSRSAHAIAKAATSACLDSNAPAPVTGISAPIRPTAPTVNVQIVSTHPELRVPRQASQASDIPAPRAAATQTSVSRKPAMLIVLHSLQSDQRLQQAAEAALQCDISLQRHDADARHTFADCRFVLL